MINLVPTAPVSLTFHPTSGVVHHRFTGAVDSTTFRRTLERGIALLTEHGATKWLSDERMNSTITPEDEVWVRSDWAPRCLAAGWRHWAIVPPQSLAGRMRMRSYGGKAQEFGVEIEFFTHPDAALAWLEGC